MAVVKVKTRYQVTLPGLVRRQAGVAVGDLLEATAKKGIITLTPKVPADRTDDEYTADQRRIIDRQIARGLDDIKKGRVHGPFETHAEMIEFLHSQVKKSNRQRAKKT